MRGVQLMTVVERVAKPMVELMIRRSVRSRFRSVYWSSPPIGQESPVLFYANHHGWMDGYLVHIAGSKLGLSLLAWVESFDEFPLFRSIGGLPFPRGDAARRGATIRQSIRLLKAGSHSLILFPEGRLGRPGPVGEFFPGMGLVAARVPDLPLIPIGIRYEMSIHERPEAWLTFGEHHAFESLENCRERVSDLLESDESAHKYELLFAGTPSINERMGLARRKQ